MKLRAKKAAMFGLEGESLKKQSGELFLARLQRLTFRLVEGHQATRPLNSKAAMFGLDARIALAIFGALSVIAGAALYSAIENTEATRTLTELQELGKAWESYYIDTGENLLPIGSTIADPNYYKRKVIDLKHSPGIAGWKGPYLNAEDHGNVLKDQEKIWFLIMLNANIFPSDSAWWNNTCSTGIDCAIYAYFAYENQNKTSMAKKIDKIVDLQDGEKSGKFRYFYETGTNYTRIYLKIAPIANPND